MVTGWSPREERDWERRGDCTIVKSPPLSGSSSPPPRRAGREESACAEPNGLGCCQAASAGTGMRRHWAGSKGLEMKPGRRVGHCPLRLKSSSIKTRSSRRDGDGSGLPTKTVSETSPLLYPPRESSRPVVETQASGSSRWPSRAGSRTRRAGAL